MEIGIKLWSANTEWISVAAELAEDGVFDFLELFVVPGSIATLDAWSEWNIPKILHAAHSHTGLNMALPDVLSLKKTLFVELNEFLGVLDAEKVVFHPGVDGDPEDTIANIADLKANYPLFEEKILLENKPSRGLNGEPCVGIAPDEIRWIIESVEIGFCLDFGHALAAANTLWRPWREVLREFTGLEPMLFHLSDGDIDAEVDSHLNLGDGDYPIADLVEMCPTDAKITLETAKDVKLGLADFAADADFMQAMLGM